jgi:hypothetical protein
MSCRFYEEKIQPQIPELGAKIKQQLRIDRNTETEKYGIGGEEVGRVADPHHLNADPTFRFICRPGFCSSLKRCESAVTGLQTSRDSLSPLCPTRLHCERLRPFILSL